MQDEARGKTNTRDEIISMLLRTATRALSSCLSRVEMDRALICCRLFPLGDSRPDVVAMHPGLLIR